MNKASQIIDIAKALSSELRRVEFLFDGVIYNPFEYALDNYKEYVSFAIRESGQRVMLLGMNAGAFGMTQTGIPFGAVDMVKSYLKIDNEVVGPPLQSDKRPITGMNTRRNEFSGMKVWTVASMFGPRDEFFKTFTVLNYCPLCFIDRDGRNVALPDLALSDRKALEAVCDKYLKATIDALELPIHVGIGNYASKRIERCGKQALTLLHPSPLVRIKRGFWPNGAYEELKGVAEKEG